MTKFPRCRCLEKLLISAISVNSCDMAQSQTAQAMMNTQVKNYGLGLGKSLGSDINVGLAMATKILYQNNGEVV